MFKKTVTIFFVISIFSVASMHIFCLERESTITKSSSNDLMLALDANNIELAKELLVKNSPEVNKKNPIVNIALFKAVLQKNKAFIKLLLDHGANLFAPNDTGDIPWLKALESNDEDLINFLRTYTPINKKVIVTN